MTRSSILSSFSLNRLSSLSDLIRTLELALNPAHTLRPVPTGGLFALLARPRWTSFRITAILVTLFLVLAGLALVVRAEFVQRLRSRDLGVLELLPSKLPGASILMLRLACPGKTDMVLGFPFIKAAAAVTGGQLRAAFCPNHFDIVRAHAAAVNKLFLLLVPGHHVAFAISASFVCGKIKGSPTCLFGECSAISQGVPKIRVD